MFNTLNNFISLLYQKVRIQNMINLFELRINYLWEEYSKKLDKR